MRFEWDAAKAASNFTKHGLTFDEATACMPIVEFDPRKRKRRPNSAAQLARFARLSRRPDAEIDMSDIPELTEEWFRQAQAAAKAASQRKTPVALRLDADVLAWFRAQGRGYQSQINAILRAYSEAHRGGQLEELGVKARVADLQRGAHSPGQGWRIRGRTPAATSRSDS